MLATEITVPATRRQAARTLRAVVGEVPTGIGDKRAWAGELRTLDDERLMIRDGEKDHYLPTMIVAFGPDPVVRIIASLRRLALGAHDLRVCR